MSDMRIEEVWATVLAALGHVTLQEIWSAALGAAALLSTHLAGEQRRSAWVVGLISQAGWLGFMFLANNFGFLVSFIGFTFVYIKNHRKWTRLAKEKAAEQTAAQTEPVTEPQARPPCRCQQLALATPMRSTSPTTRTA